METLLEKLAEFSEDEERISAEVNRNTALYRAGRASEDQVCDGWRKMARLYEDSAEFLTQFVADNVDDVSPEELTLLLQAQNDFGALFEQWWVVNQETLYACGIW